jgi:uncharacterized repeat protein (TIGR02543 family)
MLHKDHEVTAYIYRKSPAGLCSDPAYCKIGIPILIEWQPFSSNEAIRSDQQFSNVIGYFTCNLAVDIRSDDDIFFEDTMYSVTVREPYRNLFPHYEVYVSQSQGDHSAIYSVLYDGNGHDSGVAPADLNTYELGFPASVSANTGLLSKTGFTFAGWNTAADGSGVTYAVGTAYTIGSKSVTLYALWV